MRKIFLTVLFAPIALLFSACNPVSYFMLYQYSSADKPDTVADKRMSELEREREDRMSGNRNYRDAEIEAYRRARGLPPVAETTVDTRPVSTEELRARMEKEAEERRKRR